MFLAQIDENSLQRPEELIALWREQRATRVGQRLCLAGLVLSLIATAADLRWSPVSVVQSDLVLLTGCLFPLLWMRLTANKVFIWWPLLLGFWVSCIPSLLNTGGITSPFFGIDLALMVMFPMVMQTRWPLWIFLSAALVHLPVFYFLDRAGWVLHDSPPRGLAIAVTSTTLIALGVCIHEFLQAESEISRAFAEYCRLLLRTRADLQKEEESNAAKTTFLANVSHELRTPLTAIIGFADLLMRSEAPTVDRQAFTQAIFRNGRQLSRLVDDLLDLSKVEIGKIEIQKNPVELRELIEEVLSQARLQAKQKAIRFEVREIARVPRRISTDAIRLRQILLNLLGNAVKFTERGEITIEIGETADGRLSLAVRDTGLGMSVAEQELLFRPFSQIDPSLSRRFGGTGLGLHLSRKLARLLGGDLILEKSAPGQGSSFVLIHPLDETKAFERVAEPAINSSSLLGKRILVVEDTEDTQRLLRLYLEDAGAIVEVASDGFEGMKKAIASPFDLIVLDIQMPLMDGYEVARALRRQAIQAPILALTAHSMPAERERCLQAGCDAYLSKPLENSGLLTAIESLLESPSQNHLSL